MLVLVTKCLYFAYYYLLIIPYFNSSLQPINDLITNKYYCIFTYI
jgi:hypothetical protein